MGTGKERVWLTGERVCPWEHIINMNISKIPEKFDYKYSILDEDKDEIIWEREPSRRVVI